MFKLLLFCIRLIKKNVFTFCIKFSIFVCAYVLTCTNCRVVAVLVVQFHLILAYFMWQLQINIFFQVGACIIIYLSLNCSFVYIQKFRPFFTAYHQIRCFFWACQSKGLHCIWLNIFGLESDTSLLLCSVILIGSNSSRLQYVVTGNEGSSEGTTSQSLN